MDELVLNNTKLVYVVLKKLNLFSQRDYYYEIGIEGLVKAAKTYNPDRDIAFSTYACICIRNSILMDIRSNKKRVNDISLETTIELKNSETTLYNIIESDYSLEEELERKDLIYKVRAALSFLNDGEIQLYKDYFVNRLSQQQIATKNNRSQAQVSRKLTKLKKRVKEIMIQKGLIDI